MPRQVQEFDISDRLIENEISDTDIYIQKNIPIMSIMASRPRKFKKKTLRSSLFISKESSSWQSSLRELWLGKC